MWCIFKGESDARNWVDILVAARAESSLIVCDIVFAELAPLFKSANELAAQLEALGIEFDAISPASAFFSGEIFKEYRRSGGPRTHLIPDFLIGAHALMQADRMVALDRGYLRRYFPELKLLSPHR